MLTGDDGNGGSTATTTIHNKVQRNEFIDNGDGLELTRGAAFNLVARNIFRSTNANPEPSQGIEVLLGHDNVIVNNRFEGYSDGIQVNGGNRNYIGSNVFTDNALALSMTGEGNVIDSNTITGNAVGVALRPAARMGLTRITRNVIHANGKDVLRCWSGGSCDPKLLRGGIVFGVPAQEHAAYVGERGGGVPVDPAKLTQNLSRGRARVPGPAEPRHRSAGDRKGHAQRHDIDGNRPRADERAARHDDRAVRQSQYRRHRGRDIPRRDADCSARTIGVFHHGRGSDRQRADRLHRHGHDDRRRDIGVQPPGRHVRLDHADIWAMFPPSRIVCLTEETVETLYLLGEEHRIVGVSGYAVRPPRVRREKPRVSAFISADFEKIIALKPDLVLTFSDLQADIAAELIRRSIAVHAFNQRDVAGIFAMIRTLGALVGAVEKAEALAVSLEDRLDAVREQAAALPRRPRVYFEEWDEPMISGIQWVSELIEAAGGIEVFPEARREQEREGPHRVGRRRDRRRARHHHRLMVRQEIRAGEGHGAARASRKSRRCATARCTRSSRR